MLGDLLIKPHQRITKYPLLLQAVLKRTPNPQTREALTTMVGARPPEVGRLTGAARAPEGPCSAMHGKGRGH